MEKITLPWARKFRELQSKYKYEPNQHLEEFEKYCDEKEKEINELWEKKLKEELK